MPENIIKTRGPLQSANPGVGGGASKNFPVFGIVKDNIDPNRSGRIRVLIGDKSPQDSDNADSWVTVSYLSTFFGRVTGGGGQDDNGTYTSNPSSYGQWNAPPDIGTTVICIFVNGDPNYGFYIGSVPEPEMLQMVPAIGSSDNIIANEGEAQGYGGATRLPVTNFNNNNAELNDSGAFNDSPRPVHSYTAAIMNQQGIIRDPIRGPISSSANREAASRVGWGVSTPGRPIYEGGFDDASVANNLTPDQSQQLRVIARRGGHSIVMDDGDIIGRDQLVRIRTALGHQILMSDDGQTLMILHSNGQSYIELGKEGTVDIYSTNSFNVRTQGDINLHADRNINIHAMENLNIQAKNIQTNTEEKTQMRAGSDFNIGSVGKLTGLAGGAIAWGAAGDASLVGGGQAFVNGSKVNLNSGAPGTTPDPVGPIPLVAQTDTLFDQERGFIAAPGKLLTIASRAPAHAPWANAGQGVDVSVSMDAAANLPPVAPAGPAAASDAAAAVSPAPPNPATVASVPPAVPPVSPTISNNSTAAVVAQTATTASTGPLNAATTAGAAVVDTAQGKVAAVGAMAQTPAQLENGGTLKPGVGTIINTLIQAGKTVVQAMPSAVFSGSTNSAKNITSLITNTAAQTTNLVNTMQKAQTALGTAGVITGRESPTQIAGVVTAAATTGIGPTIDAIKATSAALNNISGVADNVIPGAGDAIKDVSKTLSTTATVVSGVSTIANKLSSLSSSTPSASSLTGAGAGPVSGAVGAAANQAENITNTANAAIADAKTAATGAINKAEGALKAIGSGDAAAQLTEAIGGLGGIQSALTSMGAVPELSELVNKSKGVAASAFEAIKRSFKPLKANVPQNLTQIAKENATAAATVSEAPPGQTATDALNKAAATAKSTTTTLSGALNTVNNVVNTAKSVVGAAGGVANTLGIENNTISSITGAINKAANVTSISSATNSLTTTINNNTAVSSTTNTTPNSNNVTAATGNPLNVTTGGVNNAVAAVNASAGASSTLKEGTKQLASAAAVVQQGAQASTSSISAGGLSNLPGGINTVATVTNNAPNATNVVPGTQDLSAAIKSASTSVMNGLSTAASASTAIDKLGSALGIDTGGLSKVASTLSDVSKVVGAIDGAANKLGELANTVKSPIDPSKIPDPKSIANGLTALASAGLPAGAIAELQSSICSLAAGVPGAINLPSVAFNTTDRGAVTAQISSVLGNPKIPTPNLVGEIPQETKDAIQTKIDDLKKKKAELNLKRKELKVKRDTALKEYNKAKDNLPAGDPTIMTAYKKYSDAFDEWQLADLEYTLAGIEVTEARYKQIDPAGYARAQAAAQAQINTINGVVGG